MDNQHTTILDYEENIISDHLKGVKLGSNDLSVNAVGYLLVGIERLAREVKVREVKLSETSVTLSLFSYDEDDMYISCMFHWFSISLCNYLRAVKLVDIIDKENLIIYSFKDPDVINYVKNTCRDYVISIVPDIYVWRNKVAAHFAGTDPKNDSLSTIFESLIPAVGYMKGRFYTNPGRINIEGIESDIPNWSVTDVYEKLTPRFWPEKSIENR